MKVTWMMPTRVGPNGEGRGFREMSIDDLPPHLRDAFGRWIEEHREEIENSRLQCCSIGYGGTLAEQESDGQFDGESDGLPPEDAK